MAAGCSWSGLATPLESWEGQEGFQGSNPLLHPFASPQFSATVTIPIWQWFLTRFGKKTAVYIGISVSGAERVGPGLAWGLLLGAPQLTHLPTPTLLVSSAISHLGGPHGE